MTAPLLLLRNAEVHAPEALGLRHLLLGGGRILWMGEGEVQLSASLAVDRRHHGLQVRTAGHLGHDAAEPGVLVDAAGHGVGEQGLAVHDADPGLVARRLDAQHERTASHRCSSLGEPSVPPPMRAGRCRRMTSASTSP